MFSKSFLRVLYQDDEPRNRLVFILLIKTCGLVKTLDSTLEQVSYTSGWVAVGDLCCWDFIVEKQTSVMEW